MYNKKNKDNNNIETESLNEDNGEKRKSLNRHALMVKTKLNGTERTGSCVE